MLTDSFFDQAIAGSAAKLADVVSPKLMELRGSLDCRFPPSPASYWRAGKRRAGRPLTGQRAGRQRRALRTEPVGAPATPRSIAKLAADNRAARHHTDARRIAKDRPLARLRVRSQTNNR